VRLSLRAELAADYFDLRALDSERTLFDSTVAEFEQALKLTQARHDAGIATGIDVAQAQTQLESTRATATDLAVQRAQLEHAIAVLVGEAAPRFSLPSAALADNLPAVPAGLPSQLLERRPDVAAAERRAAAANATIGAARSAFFPTLMLNASAGVESTSLATWLSWPSRFWSLGPALAQTLFDGGARRAALAGSEAAYDAAVANYRESVLAAFQEVEDNLAALNVLRDEAQQQAAAVTAAQRSLTLSLDQYKGGVTPYLQVITAQNALLSSQQVALDIQHRRLVATVQLVKALGGGWSAPKA
jgi:NodT family efflux transporter outer membrane factor (OMF) lipoprotein